MISRYIRRIHMYLALFLAPWFLAFALSNIAMNHKLHIGAVYEVAREEPYTRAFDSAADNRAVAEQVMEDLGMLGPYWINRRKTNAERLTFVRDSPLKQARITYFRTKQRVTIERQQFKAGRFMESFHRGGFGSQFMANHIWGVLVDALVIGMLFWVLSGLYMWWELKPTRKWGFLSLGVGAILFVVSVLSL